MRMGRRFFQTTTLPSRAALALAGRSVVVVGTSPTTPTDRPNASNTGATSPIGSLTQISGVRTLGNGQTLENFFLTGQIRVTGSNVTIRNGIIDFRKDINTHAINAVSAGSNLLIEDVEIYSPMTSAHNMTIGLYGNNFTARRLHIHDAWADGCRPLNNCVLEDSYFHSLGDVVSGQHADCVQMLEGGNVIIRRNNFDIPYNDPDYMNSCCCIIQTYNSAIENVEITENWIRGGDFAIQFNNIQSRGFTNCSLTNNIFGGLHEYGPWNDAAPDNLVQLCGNVWDTGVAGETAGSFVDGNFACPV